MSDSANKIVTNRDSQLVKWSAEGQIVRAVIRDLQQRDKTVIDETFRSIKATNPSVTRKPQTKMDVRKKIVSLDHQLRRAGSWLYKKSDDTANALWSIDAHFQLLWHAERRLIDFWCDGDREPDGEPYFAYCSRELIGRANSLVDKATDVPLNNNNNPFCKIARDRVSIAHNALKQWKPFTPDLISPRSSSDSDFKHDLRVMNQPNIPPGRATFFFEYKYGGIPNKLRKDGDNEK